MKPKQPITRREAITLAGGAAATVLASCSRETVIKPYPKSRVPLPDEAMQMFARYPDFFIFSSPDKIPAGLKWEDGANTAELGDPAAKKGGTYYYYLPDFPRTLRFIGPDANGAFRGYILDSNALSLVEQQPDTLDWFPQLATHWAIGEDGRTVYFKLDPAATFSDGVPVRADDYFFCFYFMRSNYTKDLWYQQHYTENFSRITKFDDLTIAITLPEKKPDLFSKMKAARPVPVHFYAELADDWQEYYQWQFEPTTGAFEVRPENIEKGRSITLSKVKNWWAAERKHHRYRYNVDNIKVTTVREQVKGLALLEKGEIDIFSMRLAEYWYRSLPDAHPLVANGYIHKTTFYNEIPRPTWGMSINCSRPLLKERTIRRGIQYAMNWDVALQEGFKGDAVRMNTASDGYTLVTFPGIKAIPFDIAAAEKAFAEGGFTRRGSDGVFVNDKGERLSFTLTTGYKPYVNIFTILKKEAIKAGLELNLEIIELTAAWKKADEKKHDICFAAKNVSVEMYPRFRETWHSSNAYKEDGSIKTDTNNETQTSSKELDVMIEAYDKAETMEDIIALARKITAWLAEDAAFIPGWVQPYYRVAYWRWLCWPKGFNARSSREWEEWHLYWVDQDLKAETLAAIKSGKTFPPGLLTFDQWKEKPPA